MATIDGLVDYQVQRTISDLQNQIRQLQAQVTALQSKLNGLRIPSFVDINQALSAGGSNPLNLTGLVGAPAPKA